MSRTITIIALSAGLISWVMTIFFAFLMSVILFGERHEDPGLAYGYIGVFLLLSMSFLWTLRRTQYFSTLFR